MRVALIVAASAWVASVGLGVQAQENADLPADLSACEAIFEPAGMPSGVDGADERDFAFASGPAPKQVDPPFIYRCYGGAFAVRLNPVTKVPDWAAEDVTAAEIAGGAERSNKFFPDTTLPADFEFSTLSDYKGSGFDRGHQVPAGDQSADQERMNLTFVLSNMGPQVGRCFNQGIWRDLEAGVRDLIKTRSRLIVITGPVFDGPLKTVADVAKRDKANPASASRMAVPDAFFKIVYSPEDNRTMAFRISNEKHCGKSYQDEEYTATVDAIEEETGFDFFPNLPKRTQKMLESQPAIRWNW